MPVHFAPTEKHTRLASERGVDLATEFEKFRDYCQSTGKTYLDWGAALALWLRNARPDNRKPAITGRSGGLDMDNTDWAEDLKL